MGFLSKLFNLGSKSEGKPTNKKAQYDNDFVFVNKGSKVYHFDQMCATSHSFDCEEIKEKQAIKRGLKPCKRCSGYK